MGRFIVAQRIHLGAGRFAEVGSEHECSDIDARRLGGALAPVPVDAPAVVAEVAEPTPAPRARRAKVEAPATVVDAGAEPAPESPQSVEG